MTSIERTAYPHFGRVVSAGELDALCPLAGEVEWARQRSRSDDICWSGELGRAISTITLLRLISEPQLRAQIDAATNKVESYNSLSGWLAFGSEGIERNDPAEQEKMIKFNTLLSACVIFPIGLDMSTAVRGLDRPKAMRSISTTSRAWRRTSPSGSSGFGEYPVDGLDKPPEVFDPHLELFVAAAQAA